eukprot:Nk52_evm36s1524 gene=Nk52_evmTU36s1524
MKFGKTFLASANTEWNGHYLPYNHMKGLINDVVDEYRTLKNPTAEVLKETESYLKFTSVLDREMVAINQFYTEKEEEFDLEYTTLCTRHMEMRDRRNSYENSKAMAVGSWAEPMRNQFHNLYIEVVLLIEYGSLNFQAFKKILSKFDKRTGKICDLSGSYHSILAQQTFNTSPKVDELMQTIENSYADVFCEGNRRAAIVELSNVKQNDPRMKPRELPSDLLQKGGYIIDMDGVLYYENEILKGVPEFIDWLKREKKRFLFLTNSSDKSPKEISLKLKRLNIDVDESHIYTSALSTAAFLHSQKPRGSAYVIGESGLISALYDVGYTVNDVDPDFVVIGECVTYTLNHVRTAVNLVRKGARLVGTNLDMYDVTADGVSPGTGALVSPIELASGVKCYFLGKPNPLMVRSGLRKIGCYPEDAVIIGDRMDTDMVAGIESGIDTCLVLSGVTKQEDLKSFAFRPTHIVGGIFEIMEMIHADD